MINETKAIIDTILSQTSKGFIKIKCYDYDYDSSFDFYVKLYAKCNGKILSETDSIFSENIKGQDTPTDNTSVLEIPDPNLFAEKVDDYLKYAFPFYSNDKNFFMLTNKSYKEKLFLDLIVNAGNYDYTNIYSYIDTRTKMLQNTIQCGIFPVGTYNGFSVTAQVEKVFSNLEAPYRMHFIFSNDNKEYFQIPSITFGLVDNSVYIYAIQSKKDNKKNSVSKTLDRFFRKVNKDIPQDDEILSVVSPNALVSLTLFLSIMKQNGIKGVIAPNFQPTRFYSNKSAKLSRNISENEKEKFLEKHYRDQFNITNKFTNTMIRYCHHFQNCEYFYDDIRQQSTIKLSKQNPENDNIIFDIDKIPTANIKLKQESIEK